MSEPTKPTEATAGPWRWEINPKHHTVRLCGGKRLYDLTVMGFQRWGMGSATPTFITADHLIVPAHTLSVVTPGREHHAEWFRLLDHPDARLIEAAPLMLEALEALTDPSGHIYHGPGNECTGECRDVQAAIKKARGQK